MRLTLTVVAVLIGIQGVSQRPESKRGFVGITLGPALSQADLRDKAESKTGLNLNLLNFGYAFGGLLGVASTVTGGFHFSERMQEDALSTYAILAAGPMLMLASSEKSLLCFRIMAGGVHSLYEYRTLDAVSTSEDLSTGYIFGFIYSYAFSAKWCLLTNADFLSARSDVYSQNGRIAAISLNAGIGFNLR